MNILIIGTTDILGGAAKISWAIKERLEKDGHHVDMFVADKRSVDPNVHIISRQKWRKYLGFLLAIDDLLKSDWILKTDEFKKADIIHVHNIHGRFLNLSTLQKISLKKPVIWTLHDEWAITPHCACTFETTKMKHGLYVCQSIDSPPRLLWDNTRYLSWRKNSLYKKLKVSIVTPSLWLKNRVQKTILASQDIQHIPNGIDINIFVKKDTKKSRDILGLPPDKKIILFLADDPKNNPWKGWVYTENVIQKYRNNSDILFVSVGGRIPQPDTESVRHIGYTDDKEKLAMYYSAADALLFTSTAENFPLVVLEAMSCGLPIVSFDVGGVKEAVELILGIEWILHMTETEREQIGIKSQKKVREKYSEETMYATYLKSYTHKIQNTIKK
jgi:glycosyltransferase involved in cell wall biosynthesis